MLQKVGMKESEGICRRPVTCESDEYYFATLLAHAGQEGAVNCRGSVVHDKWRPLGVSPFANRSIWEAADVTAANIAALRGNKGRCDPARLIR